MKYAIEYKGLTQEQGDKLVAAAKDLGCAMMMSFVTWDSKDPEYKPEDSNTWKVWLGNFTLVLMGDDVTAARDKFVTEANKIAGLKPTTTSKQVTEASDPVLFKMIQSGPEATAAKKAG